MDSPDQQGVTWGGDSAFKKYDPTAPIIPTGVENTSSVHISCILPQLLISLANTTSEHIFG